MSRRMREHLFPFIALVTTLQGCAVLTIDVDVYKGPLLNQRSVQVEQVIGMASAAKPLLVALREKTENDARKDLRHPLLQEDLFPGENPLGYLSPLSPITKTLRFDSKPAMHINEILALYSSDGDPATARLYQEIVLSKARFDIARQQFNKSYTTEASTWLPDATDQAPLTKLRESYQCFLKKEPRNSNCLKGLLDAHNSYIEKSQGTLNPTMVSKIDQGANPPRIAIPTFAALKNRKIVSAHADWLKIPNPEREAFIDTVTSIAKAFFNMADAQAYMWRTTLPLVIRSTPPQAMANTQPTSAQELALDKMRQYLIQTTAIRILHCAVTVVPPKLPASGDVPAVPEGWAARLKVIFQGIERPAQQLTNPCTMTWGDYKKAANTQLINDRLLEFLREQPGQTARDLLDADAYASATSQVNENSDRRQYGIVMIPENPTDSASAIEEDIARLSTASVDSLGVLQQEGLSYRGLIPGGLDALVRRYLTKRLASPLDTISGPKDQDLYDNQQTLLHALVHFADSLLTTANYVKLLDRDGQHNCWTLLSIIPIPGSCPTSHNLDEYVSVLQAIGNSILFQVDEIRRRDFALEKTKTTSSSPILPMPAAILRSSVPATTLQTDPKNLGANMLDELKSSLEDIRRLIFRSQTENRDLLLEELDKQAWQRINQIKVRGVGRTNYVVAKDDIGNWYVKNFESKPDKIFESARNLASFGLSSGIAPVSSSAKELLTRRTQEDQPAAVDSLIAGSNATLKADLEKVSQSISKDRNAIRDNLLTYLSQEDLLKDHIVEIKAALPSTSHQSRPFPAECADFFEDATLLCEELHTTKEFSEQLRAQLHNDLAFPQDTDTSVKEAIRKKADAKTSEFLKGQFSDWTNQTRAVLQKYERTLQPLSQ